MKEILELIENVDPSDTAKLDEIDARVWCLVKGREFVSLHRGDPVLDPRDVAKIIAPEKMKDDCGDPWNWAFEDEYGGIDTVKGTTWKSLIVTRDGGYLSHFTKYTRSRDALKAIRPEGWFLTMEGWPQDKPPLWRYKISLRYMTNFISPPLQTEELAELHAIIQAIGYDRSKNA